MSSNVIESVTFRTFPDVPEAEFTAAAEATSLFLKSCDGFVRRQLSKGPEGEWLDYVEWTSLAAAQSAAEACMSDSSMQSLMQAIDMNSIRMAHNALILAID